MIFTEYMTIFGHANHSNVYHMLKVIIQFHQLSYQHINFAKSHIIASDHLDTQVHHLLYSKNNFKHHQNDLAD